jgi:diaminohydroxyphosphoribosylaminopyrimidine deaminase / 5-amino-6-(5-phosphoribosylamino)uracil reductase
MKPQFDSPERAAVQAALAEASRFRGATSPNPPVGACAIDASGQILSVRAHERAGTAHAEANVLAELEERGLTHRIHLLFITLEPCNHQGRTPPCTAAILKAAKTAKSLRVVYGVPDLNPKVAGGGAEFIKNSGQAGVSIWSLEEVLPQNDPLLLECQGLVAPFSKWARTGLPWVTVKTAWNTNGSMIPAAGTRTFTSPSSLKLAHELRRRADAILTGSGTVLADSPELTVRHVPDHPGKRRLLTVLDRRGRVSKDWLESREKQGFELLAYPPEADFNEFLRILGHRGVLELLVEAGPSVSASILTQGLWDEQVRIEVLSNGQPDLVTRTLRSSS